MTSSSVSPEPTPVFVDPRGRRRRWAVVAAWAGSAVAATYLALVLSALLGGPTIDAPFLPAPVGESAELPRPLPSPSVQAVTLDPVVLEGSDAPADSTTSTASREESTPDTVTAPETTADSVDAPGNSGAAPGQTVSTTSPGADNRAAPDPHSTGRPQP